MALIKNNNLVRTVVPKLSRYISILIGVILLFSWLNPFFVINAGHRGVKTTFGKVEQVVFD